MYFYDAVSVSKLLILAIVEFDFSHGLIILAIVDRYKGRKKKRKRCKRMFVLRHSCDTSVKTIVDDT